MALPQIYKAFRHSKGNTPTTLDSVTEKLPSSLKSNEVLIRIHAVSLNYRDVAMMHGTYRSRLSSDVSLHPIALLRLSELDLRFMISKSEIELHLSSI